MKDNEYRIYKEAIKNTLPNQEKIKRDVLDKAAVAENKTRSLRWLMPVAACALTAVIICTSVPSVRAAIAQWFSVNHSVQDYVAQPEEDRPSTPELDVIIEETKPDNTEDWNIEILNVSPEWQEWVDTLNPTLGDVFFDGQELIVAADLGSGNIEFWDDTSATLSMGNPGYIIMNGDKYAYNVSADGIMCTSKFTATIDFTRMTDQTAGFDGWTQDQKQSFMECVKDVQTYDSQFTPFEFLVMEEDIEFDGVQQVEINLPLIMTDFTSPTEVDDTGALYQGEVIALMKLKFSFNPKAGKASHQVFEINQTVEFSGEGRFGIHDHFSEKGYLTLYNKTCDMSGIKMTVKQMKTKPTGAELYISFTFPDDWSWLDKYSFHDSLRLAIFGDGVELAEDTARWDLAEIGEDIGGRICLMMLPSEIDAIETFEIQMELFHYIGYDDIPYVEGQPTRMIRDGSGHQSEGELLHNFTLEFTLKEPNYNK